MRVNRGRHRRGSAPMFIIFAKCSPKMCKSVFLQQVRRSLGLALQRGWAKLMLDRCRDLVQHPNQPRSIATDATDEDDEEAHAFYHHTHPPGYGG